MLTIAGVHYIRREIEDNMLESTKRYWFAALLTITSMTCLLPPSLSPAPAMPNGQEQTTPPTFYQSCAWIWSTKGVKGWHVTVSPVHEITSPNGTGKCLAFGRWVVKNNPEMDPQFNPDSTQWNPGAGYRNGYPIGSSEVSGVYATNGEAQSARTKYMNTHRGYGEKVEELEWTDSSIPSRPQSSPLASPANSLKGVWHSVNTSAPITITFQRTKNDEIMVTYLMPDVLLLEGVYEPTSSNTVVNNAHYDSFLCKAPMLAPNAKVDKKGWGECSLSAGKSEIKILGSDQLIFSFAGLNTPFAPVGPTP
jgi:hypothetical protein